FSLMSEDTEKLLRGEEADSPEQVDLQESYIESSISLERDLERHLIQHLEQLEPGLQLLGQQVSIEGGRIDILAQSAAGEKVVIELKVGEAKDAAIGQIARYIGWYQQTEGNRPRAILVAAGFPEPIRYAAKAIAGLQLLEYKVFFAFEDAGLK
ncbi:MAG: DUF1016 family protein, partial [Planctomycetaceae bacterium]|nr:DUF1016 family protein [Planctomycetaceae bacterium]